MRGRRPVDSLCVPDIRQLSTERAISSAKKSRFIHASERRFVAESEVTEANQGECPVFNLTLEDTDQSPMPTQDESQELWDFYMFGCPTLVCPGLLRHSFTGDFNDYCCSNPACVLQIRSVPYLIDPAELKRRIENESLHHAKSGCPQILIPTKLQEPTGERVCVACRCGYWGVVL
mmetsp:Transcript_29165/g.52141  ORF Transcript_29165/g.52141 Transcript_29165/m.52141 type:complete len:176 (-) Transcript_29165:30-557(-)